MPRSRNEAPAFDYLQEGDQGALVVLLQELLGKRGHPIAIDGEFGPKTAIAVRHFQSGCVDEFGKRLQATGIVDERTWWSLTHQRFDHLATSFTTSEQLVNASSDGTVSSRHTYHDVVVQLGLLSRVREKSCTIPVPIALLSFAETGDRRLVERRSNELGVDEQIRAISEETKQSILKWHSDARQLFPAESARKPHRAKLALSARVFDLPRRERPTLLPALLLQHLLQLHETLALGKDDREVFDRFVDRVALLATSPLLARALGALTDEQVLNPAEVDRAYRSELEEGSPSPIDSPVELCMSTDLDLDLDPSVVAAMVAATTDFSDTGTHYVNFSVSFLDTLVSDKLSVVFDRMANTPATELRMKQILGSMTSSQGAWRSRLRLREAFMPAVRSALKKYRKGFSVTALAYGSPNADDFLPLHESIDLRPEIWAREAVFATAAARSAARLYAAAKNDLQKPNATTREIEAAATALEGATAAWYQAKSRLDELQCLAKANNHQLKSVISEMADGGNTIQVDNFYQMTTKGIQYYSETVNKSAVQYRREEYEEDECWHPFGPWKECRRVRKSRMVPYTVTWTEQIERSRVIDVALPFKDDLVGNYLRAPLNLDCLKIPGNTAQANLKNIQAFQVAMGLTPTDEAGAVASLFNSHKVCHRLYVGDYGFVDERGRSIDDLLRNIESAPDRTIRWDAETVELPERVFHLLLIPEVERNVEGDLTTTKYIATHNPILQPDNPTAPQVYLVETYRHSLTHHPGHWIGAISHTETLFPGESRKISVKRQTKIAQRQDVTTATKENSTRRNVSDVFEQVRDELEDRKKSSSSSNWNASASVGGVFKAISFNASGGGGGESSSSTDVLSKNLNDRVEKVLADVSSSNEVNVSSSKSLTTEELTAVDETREFANINQVQPLTFKFFQVMNMFRSLVALWNVRLVVKASDEIIPGIRIPRMEVFELDKVSQILPTLCKEDREFIIRKVDELLADRFSGRQVILEDGTETSWNGLLRVNKKWEINRYNVVSRRTTFVNSGSVMLECEVARGNGAEQYVSDIRKTEVKKALAHVERVKAEAGSLLRGGLVLPDSTEHLRVTVNAATGIPQVSREDVPHGDTE
jgi:hypothetical protein